MKTFKYLLIVFLFVKINGTAQCWQQISAAPYNVGYHSAGLQTNGTLWTWGRNDYGQLGDGTTTNRSVPIQVGTTTDWVQVSVGTNATYAIKQNGTLWAWGRNNQGQLSDNTSTQRLLPVQVLPGTTWSKVSAGDEFVVAQKTDGTLWSCGDGAFNQLGVPNSGSGLDIFTQVSADTDWLDFKAGYRHVVLLKTNHTFWGWGSGLYGVLATGNDTGNDHPISPLTATDWAQVTTGANCTFFRKNNGSIWGVGYNIWGTLGLGNNNNAQYSLTQVGTATDWGSMESCTNHVMVLKNNGTLWSCGWNNKGQLGNGSTTDTNVLAQVGTATNWAKVRCGRNHTLALDSNGTLWAWGDNSYGQLGDGTTTNRLVPTQIGTACTLATTTFTKTIMQLLNNPIQNFMQLSFDRDGTKDIEVYNSLGVLLDSKSISSDFITIAVSGYATGVYFVRCKMGDEV